MIRAYLDFTSKDHFRGWLRRYENIFRMGIWSGGNIVAVAGSALQVRVGPFVATSRDGMVLVDLDGKNSQGEFVNVVPLRPNITQYIALLARANDFTAADLKWAAVDEQCLSITSGNEDMILFGRVTTNATQVTNIEYVPEQRLDKLCRYPVRPSVPNLSSVDTGNLLVGETIFVQGEENFYYWDGQELRPVLLSSNYIDTSLITTLGLLQHSLRQTNGSGVLSGGATYSKRGTISDYSTEIELQADSSGIQVGPFAALLGGHFVKTLPQKIKALDLVGAGKYILFLELTQEKLDPPPQLGDPIFRRYLERSLLHLTDVSLPELDRAEAQFEQGMELNYEYTPLEIVDAHTFASTKWQISARLVPSNVPESLPRQTLEYLDANPLPVWDSTTETYTQTTGNPEDENQFLHESLFLGRKVDAVNEVAYCIPLFLVDWDPAQNVSNTSPWDTQGLRRVHGIYPRAAQNLDRLTTQGVIQIHNTELETNRELRCSGFVDMGKTVFVPSDKDDTIVLIRPERKVPYAKEQERSKDDICVQVDGCLVRIPLEVIPEFALPPAPAAGSRRDLVYLEMRRCLFVEKDDIFFDTGIPYVVTETFSPSSAAPSFSGPDGVEPLGISTNSQLPAATPTIPYVQMLAYTGGQGPYVWDKISGQLPPGLVLSPTGEIAGTTPSTTSVNPMLHNFVFSIGVTDGTGRRVSQVFSLQALVDPIYIQATADTLASALGALFVPQVLPEIPAETDGKVRQRSVSGTLKYVFSFRVASVADAWDERSAFYVYSGDHAAPSQIPAFPGPERRDFSGIRFTQDTTDAGLWIGQEWDGSNFVAAIRADARVVVDNRVYGIALALVHRRNTGIFHLRANRNGTIRAQDPSLRYDTTRPDGLCNAAKIHCAEILDLRHQIQLTGTELHEVLLRSLDLNAQGTLFTSFGYWKDALGDKDRSYLSALIPITEVIPCNCPPGERFHQLPAADGLRLIWSEADEMFVRPISFSWSDFDLSANATGDFPLSGNGFEVTWKLGGYANFPAPYEAYQGSPVKVEVEGKSGRLLQERTVHISGIGYPLAVPLCRASVLYSTDRTEDIPPEILALGYSGLVRRNILLFDGRDELFSISIGVTPPVILNGSAPNHTINPTGQVFEEIGAWAFAGSKQHFDLGVVDERPFAYLGTAEPGSLSEILGVMAEAEVKTDLTLYEEYLGALNQGLSLVPEKALLSILSYTDPDTLNTLREFVFPDIPEITLRRKLTEEVPPDTNTLLGSITLTYDEIFAEIRSKLFGDEIPNVDLESLFDEFEPGHLFPSEVSDGATPYLITSYCNDSANRRLRIVLGSGTSNYFVATLGASGLSPLTSIPDQSLPQNMLLQLVPTSAPPVLNTGVSSLNVYIHGRPDPDTDVVKVWLRVNGTGGVQRLIAHVCAIADGKDIIIPLSPTLEAIYSGATMEFALTRDQIGTPPDSDFKLLTWDGTTPVIVGIMANLFQAKGLGTDRPIPVLKFDCYYQIQLGFKFCNMRSGFKAFKSSKAITALYEWRRDYIYVDTKPLSRLRGASGRVDPLQTDMPGSQFDPDLPALPAGVLEKLLPYNTAVRAEDGIILKAYAYKVSAPCSAPGPVSGTQLQFVQDHTFSGMVGTNFVPFMLLFNDQGQIDENGTPGTGVYAIHYLVLKRPAKCATLTLNYLTHPYQGTAQDPDDAKVKLSGKALAVSDIYSTTLGAGRSWVDPELTDLVRPQGGDISESSWALRRYFDPWASYSNVIARLPFPKKGDFYATFYDPGTDSVQRLEWGIREGWFGSQPVFRNALFAEPYLLSRERRPDLGNNRRFNLGNLSMFSSASVFAALSFARNQSIIGTVSHINTFVSEGANAFGMRSGTLSSSPAVPGLQVTQSELAFLISQESDGLVVQFDPNARRLVMASYDLVAGLLPSAEEIEDLADESVVNALRNGVSLFNTPNYVGSDFSKKAALNAKLSQTGAAVGKFLAFTGKLLKGFWRFANKRPGLGLPAGYGSPSTDPLYVDYHFDLSPEDWVCFRNTYTLSLQRGFGVAERLSSFYLGDTCEIVYPAANVFFGPSWDLWWRLGGSQPALPFGVAWAGVDADVDTVLSGSKTASTLEQRLSYSYLGMLLQNPTGELTMQVSCGVSPHPSFSPVGAICDSFIPHHRPLVKEGQIDLQSNGQPFLTCHLDPDLLPLATLCPACIPANQAPPVGALFCDPATTPPAALQLCNAGPGVLAEAIPGGINDFAVTSFMVDWEIIPDGDFGQIVRFLGTGSGTVPGQLDPVSLSINAMFIKADGRARPSSEITVTEPGGAVLVEDQTIGAGATTVPMWIETGGTQDIASGWARAQNGILFFAFFHDSGSAQARCCVVGRRGEGTGLLALAETDVANRMRAIGVIHKDLPVAGEPRLATAGSAADFFFDFNQGLVSMPVRTLHPAVEAETLSVGSMAQDAQDRWSISWDETSANFLDEAGTAPDIAEVRARLVVLNWGESAQQALNPQTQSIIDLIDDIDDDADPSLRLPELESALQDFVTNNVSFLTPYDQWQYLGNIFSGTEPVTADSGTVYYDEDLGIRIGTPEGVYASFGMAALAVHGHSDAINPTISAVELPLFRSGETLSALTAATLAPDGTLLLFRFGTGHLILPLEDDAAAFADAGITRSLRHESLNRSVLQPASTTDFELEVSGGSARGVVFTLFSRLACKKG